MKKNSDEVICTGADYFMGGNRIFIEVQPVRDEDLCDECLSIGDFVSFVVSLEDYVEELDGYDNTPGVVVNFTNLVTETTDLEGYFKYPLPFSALLHLFHFRMGLTKIPYFGDEILSERIPDEEEDVIVTPPSDLILPPNARNQLKKVFTMLGYCEPKMFCFDQPNEKFGLVKFMNIGVPGSDVEEEDHDIIRKEMMWLLPWHIGSCIVMRGSGVQDHLLDDF